jgi:hypothetical protein
MEVERVITVRHLDGGMRIGGAFIDDFSGPMAHTGSIVLH